jgi:hypothetical protein
MKQLLPTGRIGGLFVAQPSYSAPSTRIRQEYGGNSIELGEGNSAHPGIRRVG